MKKVHIRSSRVIVGLLVLAIVAGGIYYFTSRPEEKAPATITLPETKIPVETGMSIPTATDGTAISFLITQWNVKATNTSTYRLSYLIDNFNSDDKISYARFNSTELSELGGECAKAGAAGTIARSNETSDGAVKIGDFYYSFAADTNNCKTVDKGEDLQKKTYEAVEAMSKSLTALQ